MTPNTFFFTNSKLIIIYVISGYTMMFLTAVFVEEKELIYFGIIGSAMFFLFALFLVMKEYDKEYGKIKRL